MVERKAFSFHFHHFFTFSDLPNEARNSWQKIINHFRLFDISTLVFLTEIAINAWLLDYFECYNVLIIRSLWSQQSERGYAVKWLNIELLLIKKILFLFVGNYGILSVVVYSATPAYSKITQILGYF